MTTAVSPRCFPFAQVAESYAAGRKGYPDEIFDHCQQLCGAGGKGVALDLGCGTGLSTAGLADRFELVEACDIDEDMLGLAPHYSNVYYTCAAAEELPFESGRFDCVTAFGSFHWFANAAAMKQIHRVLTECGMLCIINKNDTGPLRDIFWALLNAASGEQLSTAKAELCPEEVLYDQGFVSVRRKEFPAVERYTHDEALHLLQSLNDWGRVPLKRREATLQDAATLLRCRWPQGIIERPIIVSVVSACH